MGLLNRGLRMLIQNTKILNNNDNEGRNYASVIKEQFNNAKEIKLLVSYIKDSGFNFLYEELKAIASDENKKIQIICSLDMDITSLDAIQKLIELGVEVKYYEMNQGTFHPKVWFFIHDDGNKTCVIGSANLTLAALRDNIEAGLLLNNKEQAPTLSNVENLFDNLWNDSNAKNIDESLLQSLIDYRNSKKELIQERNKFLRSMEYSTQEPTRTTDKDNTNKIIMDFIDCWIELSGNSKSRSGQSKLWRGWYVVPDHGYIDDELMKQMRDYCSIILAENNGKHYITLDISERSNDNRFQSILEKHYLTLTRNTHKTDIRGLFVRQSKNYLINLNLCYHPTNKKGKPDKGILVLSDYGQELAESKSIAAMKKVYTEALRGKMYFGLPMLDIVTEILNKYGEIDFNEFSLFVKHILSKDDLDAAMTVIELYRQLSPAEKKDIQDLAKQRFDLKLSPRAKGVHMNYEKNVRHTMSVFGWCEGMSHENDVLLISS